VIYKQNCAEKQTWQEKKMEKKGDKKKSM